MGTLHIFRDPPCDGPTNMARDEALLYSAAHRPAALRLYAWDPPTISLGCFQKFAEIATLPEDVRGLAVVRRPTGGGAILHDRELTYCLTLDDSLPIARETPVAVYRMVHALWRDAIATDGPRTELAPDELPLPSPRSGPFFCFQKPGKTDLLLGGTKLLGSAQRRIPGAVLEHGSLLLGQRFAAHPGAHLGEPAAEQVERWTAVFIDGLVRALDLTPSEATWDDALLSDVAARRERYAGDEWTQRR